MPSPLHYLLQQNIGVGGLGGLLNSANFILPLNDLGSGAVNTALANGTGAATFTRATAAATKLSTGLWNLGVASGTARSTYLGLTTAVDAYGGYLAEAAATQLLLDPRDMTTANWVLGATLTRAKTSTGIDGTANSATRLTGGAVAATNTVLQTLVAAASSRTYSCWIKRVTGTGTIGICQDGLTFTDISGQINSATYTLVQLNASKLKASFGVQISTNGDAVDVDCNQFEAGAVATTPIPAAGTRNADSLTYQFSGNASTSAGTIYAEKSLLSSGATMVIIGFAASTGNALRQPATATSSTINDGTNTVTKAGLSTPVGTMRKRAASYGGTGMSITGEGAAVQTGTFDGAVTSIAIGIGCDTSGANNLNGTLMNVRIWQQQLPDGILVSLTS